MAEKTLGEIVRERQLLEQQQQQGDTGSTGQEFLNGRRGKVLAGYNPEGVAAGVPGRAQYLSEQPGAEGSRYEEATKEDLDRAESKKLDPHLDVPAESERGESGLEDLQEDMSPESAAERQARRIRQAGIAAQEKAILDELHEELDRKLDRALALEDQRAKDMRAIENKKKNTMDYALKVYGDEADLEAISDSAGKARDKSGQKVKRLEREVSDDIRDLKEREEQATVLMPSGEVRMVDRDVAEAMREYTSRTREGRMEAAAAGDQAEGGQQASKYESMEFTRDEEEKLKQLREKMAENDRRAREFDDKAPSTMSQQEYDPVRERERRLREYGDPSRNVEGYDYYMEQEDMYNGRRLPETPPYDYGQQRQKQKQQDEPEAGV